MKNFKKIGALIVAIMLVLAMAVPAMADTQDSEIGGPASITITLPTTEVAPSAATTYKIYKVFDASAASDGSISYTLVTGKTDVPTLTPQTFIADNNGTVYHFNGTFVTKDDAGAIAIAVGTDTKYIIPTGGTLTADEVSAIASYVGTSDLVYTATVAKGETSVTVTGLEYGYYYITTSSGSVVTVDSTTPNASVQDKNILPKVEKSPGTEYDAASLAAIAQAGTSQPYTAQINVGKGTINLVFKDEMTNQTYDGNAKVYKTVPDTESSEEGATKLEEVSAGSSTFAISGAQGDSSFTITFVDSFVAGLGDSAVITIKYSGTITDDALSVNPAINKASITSGDGNGDSSETKTYNAKLTVSKEDGEGAALEGAGFVIKNSEGKYYKLTVVTEDDETTEEDEYVAVVSWYELGAEETLAQAITAGNVTEYTSDSTGAVTAFTGLGIGTYTLVESTTPSGYNTAADYDFEIVDKDYTTANLEQETTVVNNSGTELPATGGMGTRIFYIVGAILALGAGIVLVTRRRAGDR